MAPILPRKAKSLPAGRLRAVVVGVLVNDDGFAQHVPGPEAVGEHFHIRPAVMGKKDGQVARMIPVGLTIGVPVAACRQERIARIADVADAIFMDMEPMGTDGLCGRRGGPVRGQTADIGTDQGSPGDAAKNDGSLDAWRQGTAANQGANDSLGFHTSSLPFVLADENCTFTVQFMKDPSRYPDRRSPVRLVILAAVSRQEMSGKGKMPLH